MTLLPNGWEWRTLGELCAKPQYGWTTKADRDNPGGLKLLRTTDITRGPIDWDEVPACTEEPEDVGKYRLTKGDLVVSRAGSVGVSALIEHDPPPAVFASYLIRMRPLQADARYIKWFMQSPAYWRAIGDSAAGIALQNVNAKKLAAIRVPVAPPNEQHRIVEAIEEQLSRLDAGVESMKRSIARAATLRQAILRDAFTGRLTEGVQLGLGGLSQLPVGWDRLRLGDLVDIKYGKGLRAADRSGTGEAAVVGSAGVAGTHKASLSPGPAIIVGRKGNVGEAHLSEGPVWPIDTTYYFDVPKDVSPRFLWYQLGQVGLERLDSSTAVPSLRRPDLESAEVVIPPYAAQQRVVEVIEEQFSRLDAGVESMKRSVARAATLRQAILREAFTGQLVFERSVLEVADA